MSPLVAGTRARRNLGAGNEAHWHCKRAPSQAATNHSLRTVLVTPVHHSSTTSTTVVAVLLASVVLACQ